MNDQEMPEPISDDEARRLFIEGAEEARRRIGRFNLAIVGNSGVGKSTLVNAIFGDGKTLADTGVGTPVSEGISYYEHPAGQMGIWDFEGFEIGKDKDPEGFIVDQLSAIAAGDSTKQIHVVWYCVLWNSSRLTATDRRIIEGFRKAGLKVIVVLTKTPRTSGGFTGKPQLVPDAQVFLDWLNSPTEKDGTAFTLPVEGVVPTAAVDHGKVGGKAHGLDELIDLTESVLPGDAKDAFATAQRRSLPLKQRVATGIIAAASTSAAGLAAAPIPFADAALLAPIQIGMMGSITTVYNIDRELMLTGPILANVAVAAAGKAAARQLLKVIPVAGWVINAGIAASLTAAVGEGWRRLCEGVFTGKVDIDEVEKYWNKYSPGILDLVKAAVKNAAPQK